MRFSILHVSDLHRDLDDEITNKVLLDSLENDFAQFANQTPAIMRPSFCIVTGDLVHGVTPGTANGSDELKRQYMQAEEFLVGLAGELFDSNRERIVILPGNHDVSFEDVMASAMPITIPPEAEGKAKIVAQLFKPHSTLRWSWRELCFYNI